MFTESAELYDAIYFGFKDYSVEAADIARRIREEHSGARTVLDVACGTGEHARLLAAEHGFAVVDGVDLNAEFLRLARLKHPAGRFYQADMQDFALPGRYDAIICMFSSIGYVRTRPALERTLRNFARHLAPGGIIIVEPWFPPEVMTGGHQSRRAAEANGVRVDRLGTTTIEDRICHLRFDYTIEEAGRIRETSEMHELGLFTEAETLRAFSAAGLAAVHHAASATNRGLYIARVSGSSRRKASSAERAAARGTPATGGAKRGQPASPAKKTTGRVTRLKTMEDGKSAMATKKTTKARSVKTPKRAKRGVTVKTGESATGEQIRAYLAKLPVAVRREMQKIRGAIRAAAPEASEVFSYGIPGFRLEGRPLLWYAAWKEHYSLYPVGAATLRTVGVDSDRFETSKGTIRFPVAKPPSAALVKKLVKARIAQLKTRTG